MREILFRGKKSDVLNSWVQGSLTTYNNGQYSIIVDDTESSNIWEFDVDSKTVGEYVGFEDKDGRKIFEGDIVRVSSDGDYGEDEICHVEFLLQKYDYPGFDLVPNECDSNYFSHISMTSEYTMEVIGNIHDNPELLEGTNETKII